MLELLTQSVMNEWANLVILTPRILVALFVMILAAVFGRVVRRASNYWLRRTSLDSSKRNYLSRILGWFPVLFGFLIALAVLRMQNLAAGILAGGGLVAVVIGFAFRQIGENFLAGLLLAFNRPFRENDYIAVAGFEGTVKNIELRHTHIRSRDGRDIFIPNAIIFTSALENFTLDGLRRVKWAISFDYRDDASRAIQLLESCLEQIPEILDSPAVKVEVTALEANWVQLTAFYWIDVFALGDLAGDLGSGAAIKMKDCLIENGYTLSSEVSSNIQLSKSPG